MKSTFTPHDPRAAHARFEKVWRRVVRQIDAERETLMKLKLIDRPKRVA
jgi:hypothetical protein